MAESVEERNLREFREMHSATVNLPARTADQLLNIAKYPRRGGVGGETTLGTELSWLPANFAEVKQLILAQTAAQEAQTRALVGAIQALNQGEAFDAEKLVGSIRAEVAAGVAQGLGSLKVTGELTNLVIESAPVEEPAS